MRKKTEEQISLKFIFFITISILVILFYVTTPNKMEHVNKNKTFEEMLEYSNPSVSAHTSYDDYNIEEEIYKKEQEERIIEEARKKYLQQKEEQEKNAKLYNIKKQNFIVDKKQEYNKLLDNLAQYPAKSLYSAKNVINKLLIFKGYPTDIIQIIPTNIDQSKSKSQNNYLVANFNFQTGNLNISEKMLYELDTVTLIAVLSHELDHFDKLAKTCKFMGIDNFNRLFELNKINNINLAFWEKASSHANIKDFDGDLYKAALRRFLSQNELELSSSYADFYKLAENIRNPLEISAYAASDYVYKYFNYKLTEGPMKKLTKAFNEIDVAVHNITTKNAYLREEVIPIFDYFLIQGIVANNPEYRQELTNCINSKNGDLTNFWLSYERSVISFYKRGEKMDDNTFQRIYSILLTTAEKAKKGLSDLEISTALKYKINTLLSNLVYPNATKYLRTTISDYLQYTKEKNIIDYEQELKSILTLICLENEYYTNNIQNQVELYYLKMPDELINIYNITGKRQKFLFIYKNPAFIAKMDGSKTQEELLRYLINTHRPNLRIKK